MFYKKVNLFFEIKMIVEEVDMVPRVSKYNREWPN